MDTKMVVGVQDVPGTEEKEVRVVQEVPGAEENSDEIFTAPPSPARSVVDPKTEEYILTWQMAIQMAINVVVFSIFNIVTRDVPHCDQPRLFCQSPDMGDCDYKDLHDQVSGWHLNKMAAAIFSSIPSGAHDPMFNGRSDLLQSCSIMAHSPKQMGEALSAQHQPGVYGMTLLRAVCNQSAKAARKLAKQVAQQSALVASSPTNAPTVTQTQEVSELKAMILGLVQQNNVAAVAMANLSSALLADQEEE